MIGYEPIDNVETNLLWMVPTYMIIKAKSVVIVTILIARCDGKNTLAQKVYIVVADLAWITWITQSTAQLLHKVCGSIDFAKQ